MRNIYRLWIMGGMVLLAAVALAAAACGDGGDNGTGDVREVRVSASDDLRFEPSEIRVRMGEPVRLMMQNMGATVHDFTVDEMPMMGGGDQGGTHGGGMRMTQGDYAMHMAVESHRDGMVEFTPTERGTYAFYCSVQGHREAGMAGTIIVE